MRVILWAWIIVCTIWIFAEPAYHYRSAYGDRPTWIPVGPLEGYQKYSRKYSEIRIDVARTIFAAIAINLIPVLLLLRWAEAVRGWRAFLAWLSRHWKKIVSALAVLILLFALVTIGRVAYLNSESEKHPLPRSPEE